MKKTMTILVSAAMVLGATVTQVHAEDFLIGEHIPMSGKLARTGEGMKRGIETALQVVNEKYAGKHTFRIEAIDDESDPAKAVAAVDKLASMGVQAITGGYGSNNIGPASEAANKAGIPYITSGGVAPGLSQRGFENFFRINNQDGYAKAAIGLMETMQPKTVSIMFSNKEATTTLAETVGSKLKADGMNVKMHEFDANTSDFKSLMNKIKIGDRPDVIFMVGYENDYVGILRAGKVLRPNVKAMVGVWSLATNKMANEFPDLMENVYGTAMLPYPAEFKNPESKAFAEAYEKLHGEVPGYLEQFGYVQTRLMLEAIVRAYESGKLNSAGISEELRKTDTNTIIGRVRFDENGDNPEFKHRMGQHQNGKIPLVWPSDAATASMNFPATPW